MDEPASVTGLLLLARALYLGSGMALVNAAVFRWLILAPALGLPGPDEALFGRRLRVIFFIAAPLLALASVLWFWAAAAGMSGTSLPDALDPTIVSIVLFQTRFGAVCLVRLGLFALLALLAWPFCRADFFPKRAARAIEAATSLVAAALLTSVSWTGHAGAITGAAFPWTLLADSVHLLAGTIWPAGLLVFAWILSDSSAHENPTPRPAVIAVARRFSAVSLAAVIVLAAAGFVEAWFLVHSLGALVTTRYGHVLTLKLAVFAVMLVLAAWNRFRLLPRLDSIKEGSISSRVLPAFAQLRLFVRIELGLAVGIIALVALLGTLAPPR